MARKFTEIEQNLIEVAFKGKEVDKYLNEFQKKTIHASDVKLSKIDKNTYNAVTQNCCITVNGKKIRIKKCISLPCYIYKYSCQKRTRIYLFAFAGKTRLVDWHYEKSFVTKLYHYLKRNQIKTIKIDQLPKYLLAKVPKEFVVYIYNKYGEKTNNFTINNLYQYV